MVANRAPTRTAAKARASASEVCVESAGGDSRGGTFGSAVVGLMVGICSTTISRHRALGDALACQDTGGRTAGLPVQADQQILRVDLAGTPLLRDGIRLRDRRPGRAIEDCPDVADRGPGRRGIRRGFGRRRGLAGRLVDRRPLRNFEFIRRLPQCPPNPLHEPRDGVLVDARPEVEHALARQAELLDCSVAGAPEHDQEGRSFDALGGLAQRDQEVRNGLSADRNDEHANGVRIASGSPRHRRSRAGRAAAAGSPRRRRQTRGALPTGGLPRHGQ